MPWKLALLTSANIFHIYQCYMLFEQSSLYFVSTPEHMPGVIIDMVTFSISSGFVCQTAGHTTARRESPDATSSSFPSSSIFFFFFPCRNTTYSCLTIMITTDRKSRCLLNHRVQVLSSVLNLRLNDFESAKNKRVLRGNALKRKCKYFIILHFYVEVNPPLQIIETMDTPLLDLKLKYCSSVPVKG